MSSAFRAYARVALARRDAPGRNRSSRGFAPATRRISRPCPALLVSTPNSPEARAFLAAIHPDVAIARCKVILKPRSSSSRASARSSSTLASARVSQRARLLLGLANRDLDRVGFTLLQVDKGWIPARSICRRRTTSTK
jgi:hypothetical protein